MTAKILSGKHVAEEIRNKVKFEISSKKLKPRIDVILVGSNPASEIYVRKKQEACEEVNINFVLHRFSGDNQNEVIDIIKSLNNDIECNAILVQLPLPRWFDNDRIYRTIDVLKDVDVLNPENIGLLVQNNPRFLPPTPQAIREIIIKNGLSLFQKHILIISRSNIIGKPLSSMLIQDNGEYANSTVTVCHDQTPPALLKKIAKEVDIIIVAVGIPGFLTSDMIGENQIIVDIGVTKIGSTLYGDSHPTVNEKASYVSKVIGGVGVVTVAMLLNNTVEAAKLQKT